MIENTNTKQFNPGPILNQVVDISNFLFTDVTQIKITYSKFNAQGAIEDIALEYGRDYEVRKILPDSVDKINDALTASKGQVTLKDHIKVLEGEKLTIYRISPLVQGAQYPRKGPFPAASHEGAMDDIVMQNQEQQEQINRSVKVANTVEVFNPQLPTPEPRKAIIYNQDGTGFDLSEYNVDDITNATKGFMERAELAAENAEISNQAAAEQAQIATGKAQEATDIVTGFDTHATEKQNDFDVNAATLTARFDNNYLTKTNEFDAHAMEKEIAFDDNAAAKQALVDASANAAKISEDNAKLSETNSAESERKSQVWAEGEDPDVANLGGTHSAKKWAEIAGSIVGEGVIQDNIVSLKTTYSSDKLEKHFAVNEDHDSVLDCLDVLDSTINAKTTVPLSSLLAIDSDARPSHKAKGAEVYDEFGTMGIIDSVTDTEAVIITKESREKIKVVDTLDIQQNGFGQYYVALTANEIRNEIIKGKIVQLSFDDVITNTGEQIYEFETFTKDNYAVFRRNVITEDKAERINIKVDYQGIVTFDPVSYKALDYKNITNCITEIPQDIKLELKDGILTLKAGSKYYKPNGKNSSGEAIFEVITIENNLSITSKDTFDIAIIPAESRALNTFRLKDLFSGDTAPKVTNRVALWYDTNENFVKLTTDTGATWTKGDFCLPICICETDTAFKNIKQTFNGFGYIGSTVFALPDVKGLTPNGKNTDGSLISIKENVSKVITRNLSLVRGTVDLFFDKDKIYFSADYKYDNETNLNLNADNPLYACRFGSANFSNVGKITSFDTKQPFHAVDYNDKSIISGWGMPSDKFVDLALGANEAGYIAPANGHFYLCKRANADQRILMLLGSSSSSQARDGAIAVSRTSNLPIFVSQRCRKGETVYVGYTASGKTEAFRFIYAEGEV